MRSRSFASIRSYRFRSLCAEIDRDHFNYGSRSLDAFDLDDFRLLHARASKLADEDYRAMTTPWIVRSETRDCRK